MYCLYYTPRNMYLHIMYNVWCECCMAEIIIGFQSLNIFDMGSRIQSLNKQIYIYISIPTVLKKNL